MTLVREFPSLSVRRICDLLGVRRTTLRYQPVPPDDDSALRHAIDQLARQWPTYGYRRITAMLHRDGQTVNEQRVRRLMGDMGLSAEPPVRRVRTTNSNHGFPRFENLGPGLPDPGRIRDPVATARPGAYTERVYGGG